MPLTVAFLSGLFLSVFAVSSNPAEDAPSTVGIPSALVGKADSGTARRLQDHLTQRGVVRIIVRLKSVDEPMADLPANRARSVTARSARARSISRLQSRLLSNVRLLNTRAVRRFKNLPFLAMEVDSLELERLALRADVASIHEDRLMRPSLDVSVPQIGADLAWLDGYSGAGQAVAILDTGVATSHSALAGKIVAEACFSTTGAADSSTSLCPAGINPGGVDEQIGPGAAINCTGILGCDHGTHVAGIAAGDDAVYAGVAPDADVVAVQVFSRIDDLFTCGFFPPCLSAYTSDVIRGLEWVYEQRTNFDIAAVNLSLGTGLFSTTAECESEFPGIKAAIDNLRAAGITTVAAAGNDFVAGALSAPGCISSALSVGAVDSSDTITDFSNTASFLDTLAPGAGITSSVPSNGFASKDGTSMAAPHGAGAVAVLGSADPNATVDEIIAALVDTGIPTFDPVGGFTIPRIQVDAAVEMVAGPQLQGLNIGLQSVVGGLASPVAIAHAGDGSNRLFIGLQGGQVVIYDGAALLGQPFLSIPPSAGLLSMAFHPDYAINGLFFVSYVDTGGNIVVARYAVSANPDVANPASGAVVLSVPIPSGGNYGGQLQFGPDGYLYIGIGDGGSDGTVLANAPDLTTLLGKVLRIDVDAGTPYAIPLTNPHVGDASARDEIWARGVRDPWRFSFDRMTGELYLADIGEDAREEVNVQPVDSPGGEHYGWNVMEGSQCVGGGACDSTGLVLPIAEYDHNSGECAISGGYVYRGASEPDLQGVYLYGDLCSGQLWGLVYEDNQVENEPLLSTSIQIITFGEDEAGNLYLADYAAGDIYLVKVSSLAVDTQSLPSGVIDTPYSETLTASGGQPPYDWSIASGSLPPGLSLDGTNGTISGVPTSLGTATFTVQLQDAELTVLSRALEIRVTDPPPEILTDTLPDVTIGDAYSETLAATSGVPPYTWSVVAGSLPSGLSLGTNDGVISGTPDSTGTSNFTVQVTDSQQLSDTQALSIAVKNVQVVLTPGVTDAGQYGWLYGTGQHKAELIATFTGTGTDLTLQLMGYDIDYNDEVSVSLNGVLLGHLSKGPSDALNVGDSFTIPGLSQNVGAENEIAFRQERSVGFKWGVTNLLLSEGPPPEPLVIETTSLPNAFLDVSYNEALSASGGTSPYTWSVFSGALPPGMSLGATDGVISGTSSIEGTHVFEVQLTDALGTRVTQSLSLTVTSLNVVLTLGVTDAGQYGWLYGTGQHEEELIATFTGTGTNLTLQVTGYDIDYNDEVSVSLNGVLLGHLSKGPSDGLNAGDSFSIPGASQIVGGVNQIAFRQVKSVGFKWGVTNLLLSEGPPPEPLVIETTSLPNAFLGVSYGETLSASGGTSPYSWSVTSGALPSGMSLATDGVISGTSSTEGTYAFEVQLTDLSGTTVTRSLSLTVTGLNVALTLGVMDTGEYGWLYGTGQHKEELIATFTGTGTELTLEVTGHDIDYNDEVSVSLNGVLLGHLTKGPNDGLNAGDSFTIPGASQIVGEDNQIAFRQVKSVGFKWGVTNLRLSEAPPPGQLVIETTSLPEAFVDASYSETLSASGGMPPYTWSVSSGPLPPGLSLGADGVLSGTPSSDGTYAFEVQVSDVDSTTVTQPLSLTVTGLNVALTVGVMETGQYGWLYGESLHKAEVIATFTGTGANLTLQVNGYDIDYNNEVSVSLNGVLLGYLSKGANNGLNAGDSFDIPGGSQNVGGVNQIVFKQVRKVRYKWGVTNLLISEAP
jgi:subtilisin family serine protease